ncbi:hypothetical protein DV738_g1308, partial [Chaetothyriales sp. CBS 135597]
MALVDYSDSDASDNDDNVEPKQTAGQKQEQPAKPTTTASSSKLVVDKANPARIRDLNLSAAAKRQLFGRRSTTTTTATSTLATAAVVTNFNMDHEYAANQELIAKGDQVMHNPVRAIAPGKHSLRQLVSAAQGQKDALEDSFAMGRRNKKEAGSKYGW